VRPADTGSRDRSGELCQLLQRRPGPASRMCLNLLLVLARADSVARPSGARCFDSGQKCRDYERHGEERGSRGY
jgi:hypothetical protein